jgi:hypothetical protein
MALFRKRQRTMAPKRGPIVSCVEDMHSLVGLGEKCMTGDETAREIIMEMLQYPVRSNIEEHLRGSLFYAAFCNHDSKVANFDDLESAVRAQGITDECVLSTQIANIHEKQPERWHDLERMWFVSMKFEAIRSFVKPPNPPEGAPPQASASLPIMAEYCHSDAVQKKAREAFLMAKVPWCVQISKL